MRKEYDFSGGKRASSIPHLAKLQAESAKGKVRITTYLDSDLVEQLKARGESEKKGYQTVLNDLLRKQFSAEKPIEEVLRQVIREELKKAA
ncbi:MAG: BrnA antitoxin family protein [Betaproteobacteria bacterium]|nr:BrnA antitoxin family protein [Betaproteobacteria bacterium]